VDYFGIWNANILRVLRGASLPCGCLAGVYETYTGTTVAVIDEAHGECRLAEHRNGCMISIEASERPRQDT
jgi:hypothetical protein